jgi:hypothetical protein
MKQVCLCRVSCMTPKLPAVRPIMNSVAASALPQASCRSASAATDLIQNIFPGSLVPCCDTVTVELELEYAQLRQVSAATVLMRAAFKLFGSDSGREPAARWPAGSLARRHGSHHRVRPGLRLRLGSQGRTLNLCVRPRPVPSLVAWPAPTEGQASIKWPRSRERYRDRDGLTDPDGGHARAWCLATRDLATVTWRNA